MNVNVKIHSETMYPIALLRQLYALRQVDLAERIGMDEATVQRAETGRRRPSSPTARSVLQVLGVSGDTELLVAAMRNKQQVRVVGLVLEVVEGEEQTGDDDADTDEDEN